MIDYIPSPTDTRPSNEFTSNTKKALKSLSLEEMELVKLRFNDQYTYDELALHYGQTIEEIMNKEQDILNRLRERPEIESAYNKTKKLQLDTK